MRAKGKTQVCLTAYRLVRWKRVRTFRRFENGFLRSFSICVCQNQSQLCAQLPLLRMARLMTSLAHSAYLCIDRQRRSNIKSCESRCSGIPGPDLTSQSARFPSSGSVRQLRSRTGTRSAIRVWLDILFHQQLRERLSA